MKCSIQIGVMKLKFLNRSFSIMLCIGVCFSSSSAIAQMSYTEFSVIRENAQKFGRLIGALRACERVEEGNGFIALSKKISSDELKILAITKMEATGITRSDLKDIDDAMIEASNNGFDEFRAPLIFASKSQQLEFCGSLYIAAGAITLSEDVEYENAAEAMKAFSDLSVLN